MSVEKDLEKNLKDESVDEEVEDDKDLEDEEIKDESKDNEDKENKDEDSLDFKEKYEEMEDSYLRLQADFTNFKKRNEKEREKLVGIGVESTVLEILPVLDNFQRAMESETEDKNFYEGMKMIENQLIEVLNKLDVNEINALNEPFDPNYHYAVKMQDSKEYDSNTVMMVLQKGYTLKDKVIRPAMVIVAN